MYKPTSRQWLLRLSALAMLLLGLSACSGSSQSDPVVTGASAPTTWNTKDPNALTNGNVWVAMGIVKGKTYDDLKAADSKLGPSQVNPAPWKHAGEVISLAGQIGNVFEFPPDSDWIKVGNTKGELVYMTSLDGITIEFVNLGESGASRRGMPVIAYGYPVGYAPVTLSNGGTVQGLRVVGRLAPSGTPQTGSPTSGGSSPPAAGDKVPPTQPTPSSTTVVNGFPVTADQFVQVWNDVVSQDGKDWRLELWTEKDGSSPTYHPENMRYRYFIVDMKGGYVTGVHCSRKADPTPDVIRDVSTMIDAMLQAAVPGLTPADRIQVFDELGLRRHTDGQEFHAEVSRGDAVIIVDGRRAGETLTGGPAGFAFSYGVYHKDFVPR